MLHHVSGLRQVVDAEVYTDMGTQLQNVFNWIESDELVSVLKQCYPYWLENLAMDRGPTSASTSV